MNDNSPQKLRQLRQFIKHHNAPEESPVRIKWWWLAGGGLVVLLLVAGIVCLTLEAVDWRDLVSSFRPPQPPPLADVAAEEEDPYSRTRGEFPPQYPEQDRSASELLDLLSSKDEFPSDPSEPFLRRQGEALVELARRFPENNRTGPSILACLKQPGLQGAAVRALGALKEPDERAAEPLLPLLESRDAALASEALIQLLRIDPFRVCEIEGDVDPMLMTLLRRRDESACRTAIFCLGARFHGRENSAEKAKLAGRLGLLLDDESRSVQSAAAIVLADLGEAAVPVIVDRWTPPANRDVKHRSQFHGLERITPFELWILARGGKASLPAAPAVINQLKDKRDALAEYALIRMGPGAAQELTRRGEVYESVLDAWGEEAIPTFLAGLESGKTDVVNSSAANLAYLGSRGAAAVPRLAKLLDSKERDLRWTAVHQLRKFGPLAKDVIPTLEGMTASDLHERRSIAVTLYCLDPSPQRLLACEPFLSPALDRESEERSAAQRTWYELQPTPPDLWVEAVEQAWEGSERKHAAFQLILQRDSLRPVPPKLFALLQHERDYVRRAAAWVVEHLGEPAVEAAPTLIKMTAAPKEDERISAINALAAIGAYGWTSEVIAAIDACKTDGQEGEKSAAEYALRRIEIETRRRKEPAPEGAASVVNLPGDREAYLDFPGGPRRDGFIPELGPQLDGRFDSTSWQARFEEARGRTRDYANFPPALVYEPGRYGKEGREAIPYLWTAANGDRRDRVGQCALLSLWSITRSRLVLYAMVERGELISSIAAESLAQDSLLAPVLITGPHYRELLSIPLSDEVKAAAEPLTHHLSYSREEAWLAAIAWHLQRDLRALDFLEDRLNWEVNEHTDHINVCWALGFIGPPAKTAIPRLAQLAYEADSPVAKAAAQAIWRIDRNAAMDYRIP